VHRHAVIVKHYQTNNVYLQGWNPGRHQVTETNNVILWSKNASPKWACQKANQRPTGSCKNGSVTCTTKMDGCHKWKSMALCFHTVLRNPEMDTKIIWQQNGLNQAVRFSVGHAQKNTSHYGQHLQVQGEIEWLWGGSKYMASITGILMHLLLHGLQYVWCWLLCCCIGGVL